MTELTQTPLHEFHRARNAKMVPFAGWEMPVQYPSGLMAEHQHTRESTGVFDVSHMGQVLIRGESMESVALALETVTPASVAGLKPWRQRYGIFTNSEGGVLDDFMFANHETHWYLVVNASRTQHDLDLLRQVPGITVEHVTDRALLAIQGPTAEQVLGALVPGVCALTFMDSVKLEWGGVELWVSRSGYTGEDGFEVSLPATSSVQFLESLLADGVAWPVGLGARDSLRLEAGMPLYGHELSPGITPVQAGIGWAIPKVRRAEGNRAHGYPGADVISAELTQGATRVRMGLRPDGRAPVREGAPIFADEASDLPIATVTSGGFGPTVGAPISMAMLPSETSLGDQVYAEVRGKRIPATVTALPFITVHYKR